MRARRALADTSVFIGLEAARFAVGRFADFEWGISAVTLGELRLGVLQARRDPEAASAGCRPTSSLRGSRRWPSTRRSPRPGPCWYSRLRGKVGRRRSTTARIGATAIAHRVPIRDPGC